jgi:hypothetical protein
MIINNKNSILLKKTFVIVSVAKQSHLFSVAIRVPRWCDCFATLAMTNAFFYSPASSSPKPPLRIGKRSHERGSTL